MICRNCGWAYSKHVLCGKCEVFPHGFEAWKQSKERREIKEQERVKAEQEREQQRWFKSLRSAELPKMRRVSHRYKPVPTFTTECVVCHITTTTTRTYTRYRCRECTRKHHVISLALWQLNHPLSDMEALRKKTMMELELGVEVR